jgi:hypothetical protein
MRLTEKLGTYNTLYKIKCDANLTVPAYFENGLDRDQFTILVVNLQF